jgi:hypothetical protein
MTGPNIHSTAINFRELSPTLGHVQQIENSDWKVPSRHQQTIAILIAKGKGPPGNQNARKQ